MKGGENENVRGARVTVYYRVLVSTHLSMSAKLLVVGLGNLTHPLTRHRSVLFLRAFVLTYSFFRTVLGSLPWIRSLRALVLLFLRTSQKVDILQRPR